MRYISCIRLFVLHGKECCPGAKGHENLIVPSSDKARENGRKGGKAWLSVEKPVVVDEVNRELFGK